MLMLESRAGQSVVPKVLLASSLGGAFGFQIWGFAKLTLPWSIPFYLSAWIILSHVLAGYSVGADRSHRWWKRGTAFGLLFSLPAALCGLIIGGRPAAYGVAALTAGVVVGLLIACISDAIFPLGRASIEHRSPSRESAGRPPIARSDKSRASAIRVRLAEEKACLERLDSERRRLGNTRVGKAAEDRIVWGELLELELQDIDEQVNRLCREADREAGGQRSC